MSITILKKYLKSLNTANEKVVEVGYISGDKGGDAYPSGITVAQNAAIHEFGLGNVPPRSTLKTPFEVKKKEMSKFVEKQYQAVANGLEAEIALGRIGVKAQSLVQGSFTTKGYGTWPDIKEETKEAKGSTQILIDRGILRQSVTWKVVKK